MVSCVEVHLVGVAGVGMSALAQAFLGAGYRVSGSDRYADRREGLAILDRLEALGVALFPQDGSGVRTMPGRVVVSTAIEDDNPDLVTARELGVPVQHRAEALAGLTAGKQLVAITGTAGKSTVTGMVGWVLQALGVDPFVVNGAEVPQWDDGRFTGSVRAGKSDHWVVEADESDRSLLHFQPQAVVVTNASSDHFSKEEALALFSRFCEAAHVVVDGTRAACWAGFEPAVDAAGSTFTWRDRAVRINMPGLHNAANAWLTMALVETLGLDVGRAASALATFRGVRRRLQLVGQADGVTVIDDYAHNPAKIQAAWEAARGPAGRPVLGVWRPHGYGPLRAMRDDLGAMFLDVMHPADRLWVLPVYDVGGTANRSFCAADAVMDWATHGVNVEAVDDYDAVIDAVTSACPKEATVVVLGARDPHLPELATSLLARLAPSS